MGTKAGLLGLFLGLLSAAVIGGIAYGAVAIYRKRKAARPGHGDKVLALHTGSPDASIEVHENQMYDGSMSGNDLVDQVTSQVKSAKIKSQHKKMSKYETMEDEE